MLTQETELGRSQEISSGVDFSILIGAGRLCKVVTTAAGLKGKLPDATKLRRGGAYLYVWNAGTNAFSLADFGNNAVFTVNPDQVVLVGLLNNSTQNGVWEFIARTRAAISIVTPDPVVITLQVVDPTVGAKAVPSPVVITLNFPSVTAT